MRSFEQSESSEDDKKDKKKDTKKKKKDIVQLNAKEKLQASCRSFS